MEEDGLRVVATRWERGWDLTLDEGNVTSVASLKNAEQQVRDYLDTRYPDEDHSQTSISVEVDLGDLKRLLLVLKLTVAVRLLSRRKLLHKFEVLLNNSKKRVSHRTIPLLCWV